MGQTLKPLLVSLGLGANCSRPLRLLANLALVLAACSDAEPARSQAVPVRAAPTAGQVQRQVIYVFGEGTGGIGLGDRTVLGRQKVNNAILESQRKQRQLKEEYDAEIVYEYKYALIGFAARIPANKIVQFQSNLIDGREGEKDRLFSIPLNAARFIGEWSGPVPAESPQLDPPAGLDRIDSRLLPGNGSAGDRKYHFRNTAPDVHVYVMDTDILSDHRDFEGRIGQGIYVVPGGGDPECRKHGTSVAGIIGGVKYGVAKRVRLHPVRVIPCNAPISTSVLLKGVDWIAEDRVRRGPIPAVVNVSIEGRRPDELSWLDRAIENSIDLLNLTYVIAAGNRGRDACRYSPSRIERAIIVGFVRPEADAYAVDSNYGPCVDIFAPGEDILTASSQSTTGEGRFSKSSAAAPHVAGVAALYLQSNPRATPEQVWTAIRRAANDVNTVGWKGLYNLDAIPSGSCAENVMLHWGSGSPDGFDDQPVTGTTALRPPQAPRLCNVPGHSLRRSDSSRRNRVRPSQPELSRRIVDIP